jgi:hypothetical protein
VIPPSASRPPPPGFADLRPGQGQDEPAETAEETCVKNVTKGAVAVAALATAQKVAKKIFAGDEGSGRSNGTDRWHAATVNLPPDRVSEDGTAPPPLRDLSGIEVRMQQAPDGKGTEIYVRSTGADVGDVRRALREAKSLLEVGDVLLPAGPPTTQPTPLNKPIRTATEHAREEGRL